MEIISGILGPVKSTAGGIWKWWSRPKIKLTTNIDNEYLRLRVENHGRQTARRCTGRLIEIRDVQGKPVSLPQLDLCWERHNQCDLPHPVDIHPVPFAMHLDLAKFSKDEPDVIKLRVDAGDQDLAYGKYSDLRELAIDVGTYWVLVAIYTDSGCAITKGYALNWSGSDYTITESDPPIAAE